jgi:hypothetical protein
MHSVVYACMHNKCSPEVSRGDSLWCVSVEWVGKKESTSGTTPYPGGASASAPPKGRKEGGQRRATREEGGDERGRKQLCTRPAANTGHCL